MKDKIVIIGSGFAGLSAACHLASAGLDVTVLEKNEQAGGRARIWKQDGFTFDMGPSWYWMPDVFEDFFQQFGKTTADFYELKRLDPSYRIFFPGKDRMDVPAAMDALLQLFEDREKGAAGKLKKFLSDAEFRYHTAMGDYVYRLSDKYSDFFSIKLTASLFRMHLLRSLHQEVRGAFRNPQLISLLEFPSLFLGATADKTPAMYTLMNYADLALGTWYPMGGMHKIVEAMMAIAVNKGAKIITNQEVTAIKVKNGKASEVQTHHKTYKADFVIAGSDYHHTEQNLLEEEYRSYDEVYWDKRVMSPSSLLFYLGVNRRLNGLQHHNLFFDESLDRHAEEIYRQPQWPSKPLFYVSAPSLTDPSVAPKGRENLFLLMPLSPGIDDSEVHREKYFALMMKRLQQRTGEQFEQDIVVKRSYCLSDFGSDYHAYKGNAYGLANILKQTAVFKPKMKSAKVKNLLYAGQLTVPGPGVPPSIISGGIAAQEALRLIYKNR